jgi:hypothetical protein
MKEDETGGACSADAEITSERKISSETPKRKEHLEDLEVDGR